jgi:hypothetical protein
MVKLTKMCHELPGYVGSDILMLFRGISFKISSKIVVRIFPPRDSTELLTCMHDINTRLKLFREIFVCNVSLSYVISLCVFTALSIEEFSRSKQS